MELFAKWLPYILAGVSVGGQYALIAIGYTMVYGILRLINFAHGDMFMMAGLVMIYLVSALPIWLSVIVVIIFTVALGCTIEEVADRPLRSASRMSIMISAIGVSYFLQNIALYVTVHPVPAENRDRTRCAHQDGNGHHTDFDDRTGIRAGYADQPHEDRDGDARGIA